MIEKVLHRGNLLLAYRQVQANQGAAGVDGMSVLELAGHLQVNQEALVTAIRSSQYFPLPILGVEIPKSNGQKRRLGIPTVTDRLLQQAVNQAIAPLFELEFKEYSYGFRPNRNAHQAVWQAQKNINEGYQHIVDMDLKSFFDEVEHCLLLQLVYQKVKCPLTLRLIRKWLRAPILIGGKLTKRRKGVPQGSPLSPLLSNILLHELDKELEKQGLRYVRYADDFSVYTKSESEARQVGNNLFLFLKNKLRLPINREKSGIRRPVDFQILGYRFVPTYRKGEKGKYQLVVAEKAWARLKQNLKGITRKTTPSAFEQRVQQLKEVQRGWVNYFRLASIQGKLKQVDSWLRNRLRHCIWHDWKKPERKRKNLIRLGVSKGEAYAWSQTRKGGWAVAQSPILVTTITLKRLVKKGYESLFDYYKQVAPQLNEPLYTRPVRTVV
ncbi:group II intron reverse transcriptase/maturase [Adhaeribacter pallidiroseus]|uniref:RNA-directed DNA polymerase n=1 Tax=Adhaeribacter pallidiroseus TaxID=2072847 RepID=A0A369QTL4_9BACT|nr:group II intron reverse transcriptase/maturase [Adhaeribacter pallidiroseus]RDC63597.1 RNA-directed DNA polymerase [Adhaeribacter pallidiroseus]RDC64824.1 RNA-directed DNA polymerase [Adhaeribacter pallidiroseus]RDC66159.1 RNA-directed DNA polymerase [Adhaeribacter pallidiroseus]RDC66173.1 RNA-directed DNA polymerase [Adhaeribacter pallidiroseus]